MIFEKRWMIETNGKRERKRKRETEIQRQRVRERVWKAKERKRVEGFRAICTI